MLRASNNVPVVGSTMRTLLPVVELPAIPMPIVPACVARLPSMTIPGIIANALYKAEVTAGVIPKVGPINRVAARSILRFAPDPSAAGPVQRSRSCLWRVRGQGSRDRWANSTRR